MSVHSREKSPPRTKASDLCLLASDRAENGTRGQNTRRTWTPRDWPKTLALDLSQHCGWATWDGNDIDSGVAHFTTPKGGSKGDRFRDFHHWLKDELGVLKPARVVYELPHLRGMGATALLCGFVALVEMEASAIGAVVEAVHSAVLKKTATGKGNAGKDLMILRAREYCGDWIDDDNEADAILLLVLSPFDVPKPKKRKAKP